MAEETRVLDGFKDDCERLRQMCREVEMEVRGLKKHPELIKNKSEYDSEIFANAMLAVRHLEDARMRLGKAIQYADGGESCYDG